MSEQIKKRGRPNKAEAEPKKKVAKRGTRRGESNLEKAQKVFELMSTKGLSRKRACEKAELPWKSFQDVIDNYPDMAYAYARAREEMLEHRFDSLNDIAMRKPRLAPMSRAVDSGDVALRKLQTDVIKWQLSKLAPKVYGDKVELASDPERPLKTETSTTLNVVGLSTNALEEILKSQDEPNSDNTD